MASSGCIVAGAWRIPAERYGNHRTIPVGSIGGEQGFGNMVKPDAAVGKIDWKSTLSMVRLYAPISMQLVQGDRRLRL